ncbi:SiaB family protein kinase [bacterium]|nr:SiaB family protein kinase [bacterium]MBU1959364.1 SiaB family protein kinase [bacterium]
MNNDLKVCIQIDDKTIYEFSGKIDEQIMVQSANHIEKLLINNGAKIDKIQNVFELFIETIQNMLNYAYNSMKLENNKRKVFCNFTLSYFTANNLYILDSCNFITVDQKKVIKHKVNSIKDLDDASLRKLIRQKSRSKVDHHEKGAGLGYIIMTRRSSSPIEIQFIPYKKNILKYKQRLTI